MHGTETPAQPNDPTNFDFPQPDANLFGDIDQNLDFDSQMETGQWRHMQQVIYSKKIYCQKLTTNIHLLFKIYLFIQHVFFL